MREFSRIVRNPEICGGQPTIRGTRVLVLDILDWIQEGSSFEAIIENFPSVAIEDIKEIIAYAKDMISGETITYGSDRSEIST